MAAETMALLKRKEEMAVKAKYKEQRAAVAALAAEEKAKEHRDLAESFSWPAIEVQLAAARVRREERAAALIVAQREAEGYFATGAEVTGMHGRKVRARSQPWPGPVDM